MAVITINGIPCDTYASLDEKKSGNTVMLESSSDEHNVTVCLMSGGEFFPVSPQDRLCYCTFFTDSQTSTVEGTVLDSGAVSIPIPEVYISPNVNLLCEILLTGTENSDFRCRASCFRVSVI